MIGMNGACSKHKEFRNTHVLAAKPEANRPLEEIGVDGRIILKWSFRK
jgi:hypothetical protein